MKVRTAVSSIAASLAIAAPAFANDGCEGVRTATSSKISVAVTNVRAAKGEVAITLYPDDKRRFLAKGGKLARVRTKAQLTTRTCFWVPAGHYAVAVYHDENGDHEFQRTLVGLPAEGFGFSNNPATNIGLPSFSSARFVAGPDERAVTIEMRYLR